MICRPFFLPSFSSWAFAAAGKILKINPKITIKELKHSMKDGMQICLTTGPMEFFVCHGCSISNAVYLV